jgi:Response regulators consisting of a CheY-like receiver domain and a winged-helix DNA-binding domain
MPKHVLIVEDEIDIVNILKAFLEDAGYTIDAANDGIDGIAAFHKEKYDLILLDIMLPKLDGFAVCQMIRKESNVPIIMVTALDNENDQIKGFDLQVDDYITKPFSMPLVLKRIEAVLRREYVNEGEKRFLSYKNIQLDVESHQLYVSGNSVVLTAREFDIIRLFFENPEHLFTRNNLMDQIWNYDYAVDDRIINTHIKNIRKKLGVDCIETIRGVGYRLGKEF